MAECPSVHLGEVSVCDKCPLAGVVNWFWTGIHVLQRVIIILNFERFCCKLQITSLSVIQGKHCPILKI